MLNRGKATLHALLMLGFLLAMSVAAAQGQPAAYGKNGMVVAATPIAAEIGQHILRQGGNAVDAVVATAAAMGLTEPSVSGPLGVGYALLHTAEDSEIRGLEFGGRGPQALTLEGFESDRERGRGAKSIAVPGALAGWITLLEEHGTMSVADVFAPAIELAEEGFPVTAQFALYMTFGGYTLLEEYPEMAAVYAKEDGTQWKAGDMFRNPEYARVLRAVVDEGLDVVYGGRIGQEIVDTVQKYGGFMALEDLEAYEPEWMAPISTTYRGYSVYSNSPPSDGLEVLEALNILEGFDLASMGHGTADYLHVMMETVNLAATDKDAYIGDPDFVDVPVEMLLSKETAAERRELIDLEQATTSYPETYQDGTTSLTVADQWGNVVVITQTISGLWGSGIVAEGTGMLLNNAYEYANLSPDHPGQVGPNRRQAWCLAPIMIFDEEGQFWATVGTPGGETIQQTELQVISNLIDFGMDPQSAVEQPRFSHTWMGQPTFQFPDFGVLHTAIEAGFDEEVYETLTAMGHVLGDAPSHGLGSNAVIRYDAQNGWYTGAADPRRALFAIGY